MSLIAKNIRVERGGKRLIDAVNFGCKSGSLTILIGPNGAGKTQTLKAMMGLVPLADGSITAGDTPVHGLPAPERGRLITYLPQSRPLAWPNRVIDLVALGRFAHGTNINRLTGEDKVAVDKAIVACHLKGFENRLADTLSGGELARVHLARAFASSAPYLIADEPVASLDPFHQIQILDALKSYTYTGGTALIVLHDMGLASRYGDQILCLKDGRLLAKGAPKAVLTSRIIKTLYGVEASLVDGVPHILGLPEHD